MIKIADRKVVGAGMVRHAMVGVLLCLGICYSALGADDAQVVDDRAQRTADEAPPTEQPDGKGPTAEVGNVVVKLSVDRENGVYRCGELATFTAAVTMNGKPAGTGEVTIAVGTWAGKVLYEEKLKIEGKPVQTRMTYDKPGCLKGQATYYAADGKIAAGVGGTVALIFDPEKLEPEAVVPADFDAFWAQARKERDELPPDLKLEPCAKFSTAETDVFIISMANVGNTRVYGYLNVPRKAKVPVPVEIEIPGAGPGPFEPLKARGTLRLNASVHPYRPFEGNPSREEVEKVYPGDYKGGAPERKKYSYYRSILGIDRLIGYLASRPDADRSRFTLYGCSQGGGLALILGGLNNDKFTSISCVSPGMCDHASYRLPGRPTKSTWPGAIPPQVRRNPEEERRYREFAAYFDAVNFARRIKCPVMIGTGLQDHTCWAENIYSAYNVIQAPKRIFTDQGGHPSHPRSMQSHRDKEWDEILKKAGEEIGRAAASRQESAWPEQKQAGP